MRIVDIARDAFQLLRPDVFRLVDGEGNPKSGWSMFWLGFIIVWSDGVLSFEDPHTNGRHG